jgi:hypothetical protein
MPIGGRLTTLKMAREGEGAVRGSSPWAEAARETLLYRGGVVSSPFTTDLSSPNNRRTPSREVLASLRGRRAGRHMMGSEGETEQSEKRPAEAERRSLRTRLVHRPREGRFSADGGTRGPSFTPPRRPQSPCANGTPYRLPTCGAGQRRDVGPGRRSPSWLRVDEQPACPRP